MARDSMGRWMPSSYDNSSGTGWANSITSPNSDPAKQVMLQNMIRWGDIENLRNIDARIRAWDSEDNRVFRDRLGLGSITRPNPLGMRVDRMQYWDNWYTAQKAQSAGYSELREQFVGHVIKSFVDASTLAMNAGQRALFDHPDMRDIFVKKATQDLDMFFLLAGVGTSDKQTDQGDGGGNNA